jgi:hypothetical protein
MHHQRVFPHIRTGMLLMALALSLACKTASYTAAQVFPTRTPLPTYTPEPTFTPAPTFTALPVLAPNPTYTPYPTLTPPPGAEPSPTPVTALSDDFEGGNSAFTAQPVGYYDNSNSGSGQAVNGEYRLKLNASKGEVYFAAADLTKTREFTMQVDVKPVRGPEGNGYGLVFGLGPGLFSFTLNSNNEYCAYYHNKDENTGTFMAGCWAKLPISINGDGFNTLKVQAKDGQFDLYVNDKFLATVMRPGFSTAGGRFGFAIAAWAAGGSTEIAYDNLLITQP